MKRQRGPSEAASQYCLAHALVYSWVEWSLGSPRVLKGQSRIETLRLELCLFRIWLFLPLAPTNRGLKAFEMSSKNTHKRTICMFSRLFLIVRYLDKQCQYK